MTFLLLKLRTHFTKNKYHNCKNDDISKSITDLILICMPFRTICLPVRNDLRVSIMALANFKIYNFVSVTLSTLHISNEIKKITPVLGYNSRQKIMQSVRITSRPPSGKRKWNKLNQFR